MTAPPLADRCPAWCADHRQQNRDPDDALDGEVELTSHERILGFAGPIEVKLACTVYADQPDPVTELEIRSLSEVNTGSADPVSLPLDQVLLDQLRELLDAALDYAGGWR